MKILKVVCGAIGIISCASSYAVAADKVLFGLDFIPAGQHAPFFVALDKGFFSANGLDVEMQRGYGSTDAVKRVAAGTTEIGFGDSAAVIAARADGLKVKVISMIYVNAPFVLLLRRDAGIKTPSDLVGKTLAGPVGSATRTMFPMFAHKTGIDVNSVNWLTTDASNLLPVLLANRASGIAEFYAGHSTYVAKGKENGVELDVMRFSDYGINIYSNGIIARDETIAARPDVLRRFVKSLKEAYAFTFEHPEEAAELLAKKQPQLMPNLIVGNIQAVKALNTPKTQSENPWGYVDREIMLSTREAAAIAFPSSDASKIPIDDSFTNEFLN